MENGICNCIALFGDPKKASFDGWLDYVLDLFHRVSASADMATLKVHGKLLRYLTIEALKSTLSETTDRDIRSIQLFHVTSNTQPITFNWDAYAIIDPVFRLHQICISETYCCKASLESSGLIFELAKFLEPYYGFYYERRFSLAGPLCLRYRSWFG